MNSVVDYLKDVTHWSSDQVYVFGGRYSEFILLLNYEMDPNRYLKRKKFQNKYDVGKNMYVESAYFEYHELKDAINRDAGGYFISEDYYIFGPQKKEKIELEEKDFFYGKTKFTFLKKINNFHIYCWQ
jgi:hypothetical protein